MRTAIFMGLIYIGDAIGTPDYMQFPSDALRYIAIISLIMICMDIVDFIGNDILDTQYLS